MEDVQAAARLGRYEHLAEDLVAAWRGDVEALARLNQLVPRALALEQFRAFLRDRVGRPAAAGNPDAELTAAEARLFVARLHGFASWPRFLESLQEAAPSFYRIDPHTGTLEAGLILDERDWDTIFGVLRERQLTGLRAQGQLSDAVLARLPALEHLGRLELGGTRRLSDEGLRHLARLPRLQALDLSEYPGGRITDRGLEVLRELPELRSFQMCWQGGITDAGVAHLAGCEHLESVDLLGTRTGDGAIAALAGKRHLRRFKTGRQVTDAGLPLLHGFPVFRTWQGGEGRCALMSADAEPNHLLVDGPFTDAGLAGLVGLDGLYGFSVFWHSPALTPAGLAPLSRLPRLGFLGCEGRLCDDLAMAHIAAMPGLRMLMAQGTVASDAGFTALSRSTTLEYLWGRECPNLTGRGFAALATMPALRGLAVSCKQVDDGALAALPDFPALTQLMPMDATDAGFRHVGRCSRLEELWCMYCRDTTDAATAHLAGLQRLRRYYAGRTRITDRSLEILGRLMALEAIELSECAGLTDAGLAHLTGLPRLRELTIAGSPQVSRGAAAIFPAHIRVSHSA